jgi:hypothetical protein
VFALHALIAGDDVVYREHPHMAHVQLPARIREHRQAVELVLVRILADLEAPLVVPVLTGFFFYRLRIVGGVHLPPNESLEPKAGRITGYAILRSMAIAAAYSFAARSRSSTW